ncbi:MAG: hypothetical protein GX168_09720, partial [Bacteroidales bacterium]|nr:hypothetical protein [Bacteroidales bacterium]
MYDIVALNSKLLTELREIAKELKIKRVESYKKQDLIYQILDAQAVNPPVDALSEDKKSDNKGPRPRKRIPAGSSTTEKREQREPKEKTGPAEQQEKREPQAKAEQRDNREQRPQVREQREQPKREHQPRDQRPDQRSQRPHWEKRDQQRNGDQRKNSDQKPFVPAQKRDQRPGD